MDGGGRCQRGRVDTHDCSCPFCTDGRLESKLGECSRCASPRSNGEASTSQANSAVLLDNSRLGPPLRSHVSKRNLEVVEIPVASSSHRRSLLSLCVGYLGKHLEDLIDDIQDIAPVLPFNVKGKLVAIARRRGLLCDALLSALADNSWEILDVSGSDVTDFSLLVTAQRCPSLQDVDISRCNKLTSAAVRALVEHCPNLRTLRCGGTPLSDAATRTSISHIVPKFNRNGDEDSWEALETKSVAEGAQALRWLVWPGIDVVSRKRLASECPRIVINPIFSWKTYGIMPSAAQQAVLLDECLLDDIDPETWAVVVKRVPTPARTTTTTTTVTTRTGTSSSSSVGEVREEPSVAEKFRLAFAARDERLAPKRAKNARQNQRRAEKAWLSADTEAKAHVWAGMARKSLKNLAL